MNALQLKNALLHLQRELSLKGVLDAATSVSRITQHVLQQRYGEIPAQVSQDKFDLIRDLALRRISSEPLQYIIGEWDFYNLRGIKCRKPCLIPRPETEQLVDHVIHGLSKRISSPTTGVTRFLEVGVGTGCISISILKHFVHDLNHNPQLKRSNIDGVGIDTQQHAVDLSQNNAKLFSVENQLTLFKSCVSEIIKDTGHEANCQLQNYITSIKTRDEAFTGFDLLISNPPYIPSRNIAKDSMQSEVFLWEDHVALDGGVDGLDVIRMILKMACTELSFGPEIGVSPLLKVGCDIWLEVDQSHANEITKEVDHLMVFLCRQICNV